jgi:hypothetical protein
VAENTKSYLISIEDDYKKKREEAKMEMFGSKIQATQTESGEILALELFHDTS